MALLGIGTPAPDFSFTDLSGSLHSLEAMRGQPIVLVFQQSDEVPADKARQLVSFDQVEVVVLSTTDENTCQAYGIEERPAVVVVDSVGNICWRHAGVVDTSALPALGASLTRRDFIACMVATSLTAASYVTTASAAQQPTAANQPGQTVRIMLHVNGREAELTVDTRVSLLDALREHLALTGTRKGCDYGQCGACTVHLDGRRVLSCLTLAVMAQGKAITTIEGLGTGLNGATLHPLQQAFIDHDGFQCGYCTSGQIMSAAALLREPCGERDEDVRECMSGNLCRCGAYPGIVNAIQSVRGRRQG